jgi:hypothetical protein
MRIISYVLDVSVPDARIHFRNPRWYTKPEPGFKYVIAKQKKILDDYRQIGVLPYAMLQEREEGQKAEKVVEEIQIEEDSKIVEELSWNEMRKLAKELSGETIKNKEQAKEILEQYF